jgi:hypothetical protein
MASNLSFLEVVGICDNVRLRRDESGLYDIAYNSEKLVPFHLSESPQSPVIGLLRPVIVEQLKLENERSKQLNNAETWSLRLDVPEQNVSNTSHSGPSVSFRGWLDTPSKRTAIMKELCERWRDTELFPDVCGPKNWRAEMYPVYADPFSIHDHPSHGSDETQLNYVFEMERSACALFGMVAYSVNMSMYEEIFQENGQKQLRIWVPTRALTKPTRVCFIVV